VDLLRWWFGEVHGVAGSAAAPAPGDVAASQPQANFAMIVQFAGGAVGSIHASASVPLGDKEEMTAVGTTGMLTLRDGKLYGARRDEPVLAEIPLPDEPAQAVQQAPDPRVGPFARLAQDWVRSIVEGGAREQGVERAPTFADGMRVQEIVDGAMKSPELGRWIDTSGKKWPV
ncbi:MAG TPA: Gfo/Idh/MocA family oxidoreductase, partial [Thermomicrobiaceae bacterium]|nr:Gfo/Idh/MocA family oxidoreductase [Thermomicrobiaceae bacterium]